MLYNLGLQFTFAVCLWILLDLIHARGPRRQRITFGALAVSTMLWTLGEAWVQAADNPDTVLHARRLLWLGAALLPPTWLLSAASVAGARWVSEDPWRVAYGAVPMLLCYSFLWFDPGGSFTSWRTPRPIHGPLFYLFIAVGWIQIALGTGYFLQAASKRHRAGPLRVAAISAGALLPLLGNLLHFLPGGPQVDLTPVFLGAGGLLIRLAILDSGIASVLPFGRSDVLEQVRTGVLIADLEGRVIDSNRAVRDLLDVDEADGLLIGDLVERAREAPGRSIEVETTTLRRPLGDAGQVALFTDRTESAQLEKQLLQAQKLESLGLLAGGVAHDFNNLLTGILGNTHLALAEIGPGHPARECLQEVIQASELAARLTNQMLAYSGRGRFDVRAIDLSTEVRSLQALLQSSVSKNVQIVLDLRDDLATIDADSAQVQQVILNLVINGAESIGDRNGVVRIATGTSTLTPDEIQGLVAGPGMQPGLHCWFEVRDGGCGMTPATVARMFDPFYSTKFAGRGLGLAAVLGIARGHRAGMRVTSEEGQGTTIRIYFPTGERVPRIPHPPQSAITSGGAGLVLVVDDESIVRDLARRALERGGYDVLLADGGRKAVELFREHGASIRLILLDVTMPDASGLDTFREIRRLDTTVPILLSSGYTEESAASACAGDAFAGFVKKPYSPDELVSRVRDRIAAEGSPIPEGASASQSRGTRNRSTSSASGDPGSGLQS